MTWRVVRSLLCMKQGSSCDVNNILLIEMLMYYIIVYCSKKLKFPIDKAAHLKIITIFDPFITFYIYSKLFCFPYFVSKVINVCFNF